MTGAEALAAHRIMLLVGQEDVPPGDALLDRVLAAAARSNEQMRIPGLDDELNPSVLDPARVRAFVEGLGRVPAATLDRLDGRGLVLLSQGLGLSTASVVDADTLARGYTLELPARVGAAVAPTARAAVDAARARALAQRAREATAAFDAEVAKLEREGRGEEAFDAQHRRFAAAQTWAAASRALADLHPGDAALAKDADAAVEALGRFATMPRTGMP